MIVINIPYPLILLFWHFIVSVLAIFNYSIWVRFQGHLFTEDYINTYLAFSTIGMIGYATIAGPAFFTGYKYSFTQKSRSKKMRIGLVGMYFSGTLILFALDLYGVWKHGIVHALQGTVFILQLVSWWFGSFGVWFVYMWQVASYLHRKTGTGRKMMFTGQVGNLRVPPPLTWSKPLPGQPDIV